MMQLEFALERRLQVYSAMSWTCQDDDHSWCQKHYIGWLGDDDTIIPCTCECHQPKKGSK